MKKFESVNLEMIKGGTSPTVAARQGQIDVLRAQLKVMKEIVSQTEKLLEAYDSIVDEQDRAGGGGPSTPIDPVDHTTSQGGNTGGSSTGGNTNTGKTGGRK